MGGYRHYPFVRKPAAHFGWDWGPALPYPGIHGGVFVHAFSHPKLTNVLVRQKHYPDKFTLSLECEILVPHGLTAVTGQLQALLPALASNTQAPVSLSDLATRNKSKQAGAAGTAQVAYVTMLMEVERQHVQLWWPHGYGPQPLYDLQVTFQLQGVDSCTTAGNINVQEAGAQEVGNRGGSQSACSTVTRYGLMAGCNVLAGACLFQLFKTPTVFACLPQCERH